MPSTRPLLFQYHYDPLDRMVACTSTDLPNHQRFHLKDRLTTELQGTTQHSTFQQEDQLLAQQQRQDDIVKTILLATDQQRSVLHALDATLPHSLVYTPYGHRPAENGLLSLLGFNGERPDPVTGHYLLGNGYRAFNPVLMRFNSPDSWSPFGEGGLNAYAYCTGDPVNRIDPTGHLGNLWKGIKNIFHMRKPSPVVKQTVNNPKNIVSGLDIFDDEKSRLNIIAHGAVTEEGSFVLVVDENHPVSPQYLYDGLIRQGVDFKKYKSTRFLVCHSADTTHPFGQEFANLTEKPVKAFHGPVRTTKIYKLKSTLAEPDMTKLNGLYLHKKRKPYKYKGEILPPYNSVTFHPATSIRRA